MEKQLSKDPDILLKWLDELENSPGNDESNDLADKKEEATPQNVNVDINLVEKEAAPMCKNRAQRFVDHEETAANVVVVEFVDGEFAYTEFVTDESTEAIPANLMTADQYSQHSDTSSNNSNYEPGSEISYSSGEENEPGEKNSSDERNDITGQEVEKPNLSNNFDENELVNENVGEPKQKIRRKKGCWRTENAKSRENGLEYYSRQRENKLVKRSPKKLHPRCKCKWSLAKPSASKLKCSQITDNERKEIHQDFWEKNWKEKREFVKCSTDVIMPKDTRNRKNETSRRSYTYQFHLKVKGIRIRICKVMFLNTLGIKEWSALNWAKSSPKPGEIHQKKKESREKDLEKRESAQSFLQLLPKMPSHYCRASTSKEYLEPLFISKIQLFREYERYCEENKKRAAKRATFENVLKVMNIGLFQPKKDQCDTCISYHEKNISEEIYNEHIKKKVEARNAKTFDKREAKFVFTMDLQAVLLCPRLNASALYYKTKLAVHNFTIYNLKDHTVFCYLWDETQEELTSDIFASILYNFVTREIKFQKGDEIIFYSDGCTYQNRNVTVSNMFVYVAMKYGVTIIQRYLEKGHTQMECDSVHSTIEHRLKNQTIFLPSGYINICRTARNTNPYNVHYLDYNFFSRFSDLKYYSSIRPGKVSGDAVVTDIRALKYTSDGTIYYKLRHPEDWCLLQQRRHLSEDDTNTIDLSKAQLYTSPRKIKKEKFQHLQQLKAVLPKDCHYFYDNLKVL